jgi:hypothetical protein
MLQREISHFSFFHSIESAQNYQAAIALFKTHFETSIAKITTASDVKKINDLISDSLNRTLTNTKKLLDSYTLHFMARQELPSAKMILSDTS